MIGRGPRRRSNSLEDNAYEAEADAEADASSVGAGADSPFSQHQHPRRLKVNSNGTHAKRHNLFGRRRQSEAAIAALQLSPDALDTPPHAVKPESTSSSAAAAAAAALFPAESAAQRQKRKFFIRRGPQNPPSPAPPPSHKSTPNSAAYPAPQPLHRVRPRGGGKGGGGGGGEGGLSFDPEYFPPIPLDMERIDYDGDTPLQLGGAVRRGSRVRLGSAAEYPPQVRYGDFIRVWAHSAFLHKGGYVGSLRRIMRGRNALGKGELFVIPPVSASPQWVFHEACFKIVDPLAEREEGEELCYGEQISLVDDRGMVWNNKDGRLHGRLGPSLFGNGGHMHLTLHKQTAADDVHVNGMGGGGSTPASPDPRKGGSPGEHANGGGGKVFVRYGDMCTMVATKVRPRREEVARSAVTHFRRRHERDIGGFLRSDGKGVQVTFHIHHAPPRVTTISVFAIAADGAAVNTHTHHKVPWNQEIHFDLPPPPPGPKAPAVRPGSINQGFLSRSYSSSILSSLGSASNLTSAGPNGSSTPTAVDPDDGMQLEGALEQEDANAGPLGHPVVRVALSNGGEVLLRYADILACKDKPAWFNVAETAGSMCLLVRARALKSGGDSEHDSQRQPKHRALTLAAIIVAVAAAKMAATKALRATLVPGLSASGSSSSPARIGYGAELLLEIAFLWIVLSRLGRSARLTCLLPPVAAPDGAIQQGSKGSTLPQRPQPYAIKIVRCDNGLAQEKPPTAADPQDQAQEDSAQPENVPETFLIAEAGDYHKALARYLDTLRWRKDMGADEALATPHPKFLICKRHYPSCFHGRDKEGSVMYYEKLGGIDVEALKLRGVGFKQLLWHYMYQMEYLWSVICPRIEDRSTIVLDMHGVNMKDIGGEVLQFIKVAVAMLATHYPARSNCIFIINVPTWFSMVFRLIRPLLNEGTRQKIRPYDASQYQNALREWVDSDELPREYGGTSPHPLFQHPWEQELVQHVRTTLSKANAELEAV